MKNKKHQIKLHKQELKKANKKYRKKKYKETRQIRIPLNSYHAIMKFKEKNGKTGSYWVDEAWRWYQKQFNFNHKE